MVLKEKSFGNWVLIGFVLNVDSSSRSSHIVGRISQLHANPICKFKYSAELTYDRIPFFTLPILLYGHIYKIKQLHNYHTKIRSVKISAYLRLF